MMWLATYEDGYGMWFADPIAADTKEAAIELALKEWPTLASKDHTRALYRCDFVDEIEPPREEDPGIQAGAALPFAENH